MPSLRDSSTRKALIHRLQQLTPATKPRWGKFDAPRMLCHLNDALAVSLRELSATTMNKKAFQHFPLKHLVIYVFPFPKGAPAPPDMLTSTPEDFDADRQRLFDRMERMAAVPNAQGPEHPLFGPLSNEEWNALHWKHIAHHLKQFGC
jgi:Protein of unknown function (DUF1569)